MSASDASSFSASQALLTAAIGGLLCLTTACSSGDSTSTPEVNEDTPSPATTCSNRASDNPTISSSTVDPSLTQDKFSSECTAQNGIMEIQPHCGGSNACRGMSYDNAKQLLTEHNCRAVNTCAGYSCVICD
jgi:hypothetical protein